MNLAPRKQLCVRTSTVIYYLYVYVLDRAAVKCISYYAFLHLSIAPLVYIYIYDILSIMAPGCNRLGGHIYIYIYIYVCACLLYFVLLLPSYSYLLPPLTPHCIATRFAGRADRILATGQRRILEHSLTASIDFLVV
jgi:hypothetical protein